VGRPNLGLFIAGCGGRVDPEKACRDLADAFGDLCDRCDPGTYQTCYDLIVQVADGDCQNVVDIRDEDELYDDCIPFIESLQCDEDLSRLDSSCEEQLIVE
jgi:hypothetical protein